MLTSSLAQLVESLTLKADFAGSRPVVVTYFFFHANYLFKSILPTIDVHLKVFEFKHVFSLFLQVVEMYLVTNRWARCNSLIIS